MRLTCLCVLLLPLALTGSTKKDLDIFQGTWIAQSLQYDGQDVTNEIKLSLIFKDDTATVEGQGDVKTEYARIKIKLDPDARPKTIDITVVAGNQKNVAMKGLYELKEDELKLCVNVFGKDRPTAFESAGGSNIALLTLKRKP